MPPDAPMDLPEIVRFGSFTLAPRRRELLFRGTAVSLGTRALDLLIALIARRGALATKDELLAEVWGGAIVDENNLAAQVSALRKVLVVDDSLQRCLQAVPGRGYRFVADIEAGTAPVRGTRESAGLGHDGEMLSLVALPFADLGGDSGQADFVQGLSHTLATDLSRVSGLLVIAPTTAATFAEPNPDVRQVSRELAVRYVLTGSIQRIGRRLRVNAQLAEGRSGLQIWSDRFDGEVADPLTLQDWITGRIANAMGREIFVAAVRDSSGRRIHPTSFDLVMRGIAADNRPQSLESLRAQESLFARAVEIDPTHADAMARLARAILLQANQVHATAFDTDRLVRAIQAAKQSVALEPGNARTHYAVGLVHVLHRDFARAVQANEAAIALDRNYSLAHNNLANSLVHLGDGDEALSAARQSFRLDPRGPQVGACLTAMGFAHLLRAEIEEALDSFSRARAANPKLPRAHVGMAVALALRGDAPSARRATEDLLDLVPTYRLSSTMDASVPGSTPQYRAFYEDVLHPAAMAAELPV